MKKVIQLKKQKNIKFQRRRTVLEKNILDKIIWNQGVSRLEGVDWVNEQIDMIGPTKNKYLVKKILDSSLRAFLKGAVDAMNNYSQNSR